MTWHKTSRQARGYGADWERLRAQALSRDLYLCQPCLLATPSRITPAQEVHHLLVKGHPERDRLEHVVSICHGCHDKLTIMAKGGTSRVRYDRNGRRIDRGANGGGDIFNI